MSEHAGEIAAIAASVTWAAGSLLFSRLALPAAGLNFMKCALGTLFFGLTLGLLAVFNRKAMFPLKGDAMLLLALSALIGIAIGDTLYYRSLQILGARRALILTTVTPPMAAAAGWICLGEVLPFRALLGMAITIFGVGWVLRERGLEIESPGHYPGSLAAGLLHGLLAAACQAAGAVLSKLGMAAMDSLDASAIRLATAAALGLAFGLLSGQLGPWLEKLRQPGVPWRLAAGSACGTYAGIWLSLVAYKHSEVAVATTLTSLSPIFVLPMAWLFLGHRTSPRTALGALAAVGGVSLLF